MPSRRTYTRDDLTGFRPEHGTFVGIDSDGCLFDTMEIKQKQCFHPLIVSHWRLEPIEAYVRESAEFVNLHSRWRGRNRFVNLLLSIDLLRDRREVVTSGVTLPPFTSLRAFIDSGVPLGNPALEQAVRETDDEELTSLLAWSYAVNARVAEVAKHIPLFGWARESLERIRANSDAVCVSQTPSEALIREWHENGITDCVSVIAGQELGTKAEHIRLATRGRYAPGKVLMIGDAPGDEEAAKASGALFYPIEPTREVASWDRFYREAYDMFLAGDYAGAYEQERIREFEALLPNTPPWERSAPAASR